MMASENAMGRGLLVAALDFSTAHVDPSMLHESMDPPYPPCLLKPYEVDTLVRTIVEAMKEANAVVVQS